MFPSGAQFTILVALVGLFVMRESRQAPAQGLDERFADFLATHTHRPQNPAPVTLISIDESSLQARPWPWSPLDYALFFQASSVFHPPILATNEVLDWDLKTLSPEAARKLPQYQTILREHLLRAEKVLSAARLGYPEDPSIPPAPEEVPLLRQVSGDPRAVREFSAIETQAHEDFRLSSVTGFTNLLDPPQHTRRVPLILRYRGQIVPSFVLQAILLWEKLTPDDVAVEIGQNITLSNGLKIPIDAEGALRIDFGAPYERCGFDEMILTSDQLEHGRAPLVPREKLENKLLLLGRTDEAARTLTLASTRAGSAGELFAAAIATIQNRSFIRRAPVAFDLGLIVVFMGLGYLATRHSKRVVLLAVPLALAVYVLVALGIFNGTLTWLPVVLPAGLAVFIALYRLAAPAQASAPAPAAPGA